MIRGDDPKFTAPLLQGPCFATSAQLEHTRQDQVIKTREPRAEQLIMEGSNFHLVSTKGYQFGMRGGRSYFYLNLSEVYWYTCWFVVVHEDRPFFCC
jgi:hypothetical protein